MAYIGANADVVLWSAIRVGLIHGFSSLYLEIPSGTLMEFDGKNCAKFDDRKAKSQYEINGFELFKVKWRQ